MYVVSKNYITFLRVLLLDIKYFNIIKVQQQAKMVVQKYFQEPAISNNEIQYNNSILGLPIHIFNCDYLFMPHIGSKANCLVM
jgi:hypothetical protein